MTDSVVTKNKVVALIYAVRDQNGDLFEYRDLPVSCVHGAGTDLFPKIEPALDAHAIGDRVVVQLTPAEAFGERDLKLTFIDDIENAPPELHPVGTEFEAQNAEGESIVLTVTHIEGDRITVGANHPLAGQTITFEVTVPDIRDARPASDLSMLQSAGRRHGFFL